MTSQRKRPLICDDNICDQCDQPVEQCLSLNLSDENFIEESIALTEAKFTEFFENNEDDEALHLNITNYSLYDGNYHLISIDSGLIESGKPVYLSGYLKLLTESDESIESSIPTRDIGPLEQWWLSGFDGGDRVIIGLESPHCRYNLLKPSSSYAKIMSTIEDKIMLTKYTIEFVEKWPDANCDKLLGHLREKCGHNFSTNQFKQRLYSSLAFILDQIQSYDEAGSSEDTKLFETLSIQELITSALNKSIKITTSSTKQSNKARPMVNIARRDSRRLINSDSYAVCTPLVNTFFENQFKDALHPKDQPSQQSIFKSLGLKGYGKSKQELLSAKISWIGSVKHKDNYSRRTFYESVRINGEEFSLGDFVTLARNQRDEREDNTGIGRICGLFEGSNVKFGHINFLCFSENTILEEIGSPNSVYLLEECCDIPLFKVIGKINIDLDGNSQDHYSCNRIYSREFGWFQGLSTEAQQLVNCKLCLGCQKIDEQNNIDSVSLNDIYAQENGRCYFKVLKKGKHHFHENSFAVIKPEAINLPDYLKDQLNFSDKSNFETYNETLYPERYRKKFTEFVKGSLDDSYPVYSIVQIIRIFRQQNETDDEAQLEVRLFYRPQNCFQNFQDILNSDLDLVYLTNELRVINSVSLVQPCHVHYLANSDDRPNLNLVPTHYFVSSAFNSVLKIFEPISSENKMKLNPWTVADSSIAPLKTLDLFSGCGGLAYGFKQSGVSRTLWAIEKEPSAARSFEQNFPESTVYNADANILMKSLLEGNMNSDQGQLLPSQGQVEMILAGPPCQGFSGMNRFSSGLYSLFKNSLIVTFLSYVDFYRPQVVVFENVRNFVQFEKCKILKLTLACLLKMDYQVNFGILQAGQHGLPQSRRRTFILATKLGINMPLLPSPLFSFSRRACQLDIIIGKNRIKPTSSSEYGFYRPITVADAINDLPGSVGHSLDYICDYASSANSYYQKTMRFRSTNQLSLHVTRSISLLNQARINMVPCQSGSDWRDLPNIKLTLSDGSVVEKLDYLFDDIKNGRSSDGTLRGVCSCASGQPCAKLVTRPENTLIPWGLVHTANRNYQWAGLFGRLQWNGVFITTITKTVPSSKQGSVLHPNENRIISLRESARSQGFPDDFTFAGNISDIKVQIGNAVPIPLACAIGHQIKKSLEKLTDNLSDFN